MSKKRSGPPDTSEATTPEDIFENAPRPPEADPEEIRQLKQAIADKDRALERYRARHGVLRVMLEEIFQNPPPIQFPRIPRTQASDGKESRVAVVHISDTQAGKVTKSYNMEVLGRRLMELASKVITITRDLRRAYTIEEIRVYLGGDLVEGERIFRHQAHLIDKPLLDQAVRVGPSLFVQFILALLADFRQVKVRSVPGNHGRDDHGAHPDTNWDTVCGDIIKTTLLGTEEYPRTELQGRLEMDVARDWAYIDEMPGGWRNLLVHGHQIRGGFAGHPWYGSGRRAQGWYQVLDQPFDYMFYGHFHTHAMATVNFTEWRANGTTESDNEYAQSELAASGYPCQGLYYYNEEHGLVQEHNIYLADPGVRRPNICRRLPDRATLRELLKEDER